MTELIIVFGALVFLAGVVIVIKPEIVFGYLGGNIDKPLLQILAVVVRLAIGALLILQADQSRYPLVIEVLGWLSVVAAGSLLVMGRKNFLRLMAWAMGLVKPFGRLGGVLAMAFGGFLVHAFV